jgi:hypothetical protein
MIKGPGGGSSGIEHKFNCIATKRIIVYEICGLSYDEKRGQIRFWLLLDLGKTQAERRRALSDLPG